MSTGEGSKDEAAKGFSGLAGMVSDVQETESIPVVSPAPSSDLRPVSSPGQHARGQGTGPTHSQPGPYQQAALPGQGSSGRKWLWGIGAVAVVAWLWVQSADDKEVMPKPGGMNRKLSRSEIRYCVSEDIRIGAAKRVVNAYVEWEVDRFNQMVADYNARCGMYQYTSGTLESVKSSVEKHRAALEAEGRSRIQ